MPNNNNKDPKYNNPKYNAVGVTLQLISGQLNAINMTLNELKEKVETNRKLIYIILGSIISTILSILLSKP